MEQLNSNPQPVSRSSSVSVILSIIITALVVGAGVFFITKGNDTKNIPTDIPLATEQNNATQVTSSSPNKSQSIIKEQGYIKSIYQKNGKMYLDIDYVQECISELEPAAKAILEDGKCNPGVTLNQLVTELQNAGNIGRFCPSEPFGYGGGYCYFRNQNTEMRTFEISPDVIVLYPIHPYDSDTQDSYSGAYSYRISLEWLKDKYEYTEGTPFRVTLVNNVVTVIDKMFVSAE